MSSISERSIATDGRFSATNDFQRIFSWSEIGEVHKVRHGIYQRGGRLISLLTDFGKINQCYPDAHGDSRDTIFYTGAGRRGDQKLDSFNRAMLDAIETAHAVPLFNKLSAGNWKFLGFWQVMEGKYIYDEAQKRMIWQFRLERQLHDAETHTERV